MKLLFKQRFFSWLDSFDVYDENGDIVYTVEGQLSLGHRLHINDRFGSHIGTLKEVLLTFLPKFEIYMHDRYLGCISKELSFFTPRYNIDYMGWEVSGDFFEWDYSITDYNGNFIAVISKELFNWTDTYSLEIYDEQNALAVLMLVLAIDAEKCSRD